MCETDPKTGTGSATRLAFDLHFLVGPESPGLKLWLHQELGVLSPLPPLSHRFLICEMGSSGFVLQLWTRNKKMHVEGLAQCGKGWN